MIYFLIPLISRKAAQNWDTITTLFNRTLWSCYNQLDPEFKVLVACHEIPELTHSYDGRVEFIQISEKDAPIPVTQEEKMIDKGYKTHTLAMRLRELGGGYAMMVDADDLVSNRIAEYVNRHPDENGWATDNLYYYYMDTDYLMLGHKFLCTHIVNYKIEDLPGRYPETMTDNRDSLPWLIRKKHGSITKFCRKSGKPLKHLPFRAYVYVRNTGCNHSLSGKHKTESSLRKLDHLLSPKIKIMRNDKIRNEFSIDWL